MSIFRKLLKLYRYWNTNTFISNLKFIIENDIQAAIKDEVLEDCVFELDELRDILLAHVPRIYDAEQSLSLLKMLPNSFSRFGDGEIAIMQGGDIAFQNYAPLLAEKLLRVLKTKRNDLYIGINSSYFHAVSVLSGGVLTGMQERSFGRKNNSRLRKFIMMEANLGINYLDAGCLVGYFTYDNNDAYSELVQVKRKLFEGRKIAIVTGKSVLDKLDYDIFGLASSKIIIDAPSRNAFSVYDEILREISGHVSKDTLICLILGPTATVMASDLADIGYVAWDVGHMAKDYDFYMKGIPKTNQAQCDFYSPD